MSLTSRKYSFFLNALTALAVLTTLFSTPARSEESTPIRIAYPAGMNGQIPVVADKAGFAKGNGLAADYSFFQNGPPMMEALASGNVDVVISSYQPLTTYWVKQPNTVSVVANLGYSSYSLLVDKNDKSKSLADLKGKKIALSFGSDSHLDLLRSIRKLGLNPATDFNLINLQPNDLLLVLSQGLADAIVIREPQVQRLRGDGARVLQTWPHYYAVIVRNQYLAEHPEALNKLRNTLRDTVAYIAGNGDQASIWFGQRLRIEPALIRDLLPENPIFKGVKQAKDVKLDFDKAYVQRLNDWFDAAYDNGLVKTRPLPYKN